ncbi:hypothetical protein DLAC_08569 [Tieghemostelium lacteum]|uniref:Transmembrane protein n=1 Tax=Tieghemostelium lacteum TaxID=361077 RepID=A0A151Z7T2_TIELA|nr:hypothetical protein DLAC_08569 [Tieghemostelium lacteum]|eukprot:KYQ89997.1 hypothetical protein DLAC_08569 [Tieghemostelium lacteum]
MIINTSRKLKSLCTLVSKNSYYYNSSIYGITRCYSKGSKKDISKEEETYINDLKQSQETIQNIKKLIIDSEKLMKESNVDVLLARLQKEREKRENEYKQRNKYTYMALGVGLIGFGFIIYQDENRIKRNQEDFNVNWEALRVLINKRDDMKQKKNEFIDKVTEEYIHTLKITNTEQKESTRKQIEEFLNQVIFKVDDINSIDFSKIDKVLSNNSESVKQNSQNEQPIQYSRI